MQAFYGDILGLEALYQKAVASSDMAAAAATCVELVRLWGERGGRAG